ETAEQGRAQRVETGEGELHLRLDAGRPCDPTSARRRRQVAEEGGLADACFAAEHQHMALAREHARDELVEDTPLIYAIEQAGYSFGPVEHTTRIMSSGRLVGQPRGANHAFAGYRTAGRPSTVLVGSRPVVVVRRAQLGSVAGHQRSFLDA